MSESQWSSVNSFSTQVSYIPSNEQALLIPIDLKANAYFGRGSAISRDATKVAFGAYAANYSSYPGLGKAYVFA